MIHDIKFIGWGSPGWENWRLGDSIINCSIFARLERVRLHIHNPDAQGNRLMKQLSEQIFSDRYELEFVKIKSKAEIQSCKVFKPHVYYLENNVDVVKPNKNLLNLSREYMEPYVTTQIESACWRRTIELDMVKAYTADTKIVNLTNAKNEEISLKRVFNLINYAEKHVGAASGLAWIAMSVETSTILLLPSQWRRTCAKAWDYCLEAMYRNPMITVIDVDVDDSTPKPRCQ